MAAPCQVSHRLGRCRRAHLPSMARLKVTTAIANRCASCPQRMIAMIVAVPNTTAIPYR